MKSIEARAIAEAANTAELKEIYLAIEKAARLGDYHTHFYVIVTKEQIEKLEAEGYKVTDIGDGREVCFRIGW